MILGSSAGAAALAPKSRPEILRACLKETPLDGIWRDEALREFPAGLADTFWFAKHLEMLCTGDLSVCQRGHRPYGRQAGDGDCNDVAMQRLLHSLQAGREDPESCRLSLAFGALPPRQVLATPHEKLAPVCAALGQSLRMRDPMLFCREHAAYLEADAGPQRVSGCAAGLVFLKHRECAGLEDRDSSHSGDAAVCMRKANTLAALSSGRLEECRADMACLAGFHDARACGPALKRYREAAMARYCDQRARERAPAAPAPPAAEAGLWAERLGSEDVAQRVDAEEALAAIGRPALPEIERALRGKELTRALHALQAARKLGAEAIPVLPAIIERFDDEDFGMRVDAEFALAGFGAAAVATLRESLRDPKISGRRAIGVANALGRIGPAAGEAAAELVALLSREEARADAKVALHGCHVYRGLREGALPYLTRALLEAPEPKLRAESAAMIGLIGAGESGASGRALKKALSDPDSDVRQAARQALDRLENPVAMDQTP